AAVPRAADVARMVDEPYQRWGRLDVLFNNAGVIRVQPLLDVTEAEWDRVMSVNLRAVFFVLQAAARRMKAQPPMSGSELRGKLIQTASIAGYRGGNHLTTPYSASKAGVISLTRSAAPAPAPDRIPANGVCPGAVDTAMWEQLDRELAALHGLPSGEAWKRRIAGIPLGRPERPGDGAGVVAFLAGLHDGPGPQGRRWPGHGRLTQPRSLIVGLLLVDSLYYIFARLLLPLLPPAAGAMYMMV